MCGRLLTASSRLELLFAFVGASLLATGRLQAGSYPASEFQARLARSIRQRLDATVIAEARAVERDRFDAGSACLLGNRLAHRRGGILVLGALESFAERLLHGGSRSQHLAAFRRDHLRVNVLAAAMHGQARHGELADMHARGFGTTQAGDFLFHMNSLRSGSACEVR